MAWFAAVLLPLIPADSFLRYKGLDLYRDAILPWLDDLHAKQVADGITTADNQDRTYPF